jgi:glucose-6-phosphate 1-epimerase
MGNPKIIAGQGSLTKARLAAPDGSLAEIYLQGGQVTSWIPGGGIEQLFLSKRALFKPGKTIRGGIPVIFPQFSSRGPLPRHGFARSQTWELGEAGLDGQEALANFVLHDSQATRQIWNRCFELQLEVRLGGGKLQVGLQVNNSGEQPFSFTAALHTYLRVMDITQTAVAGLGGLPYFDHTAGAQAAVQEAAMLRFSGEVDRLYPDAPPVVKVLDGDRVVEIQSEGFTDCVVWNPGPSLAATLIDLGEEYRQMVCVEAAAAERSIMLLPGHTWAGSQILRI